MNKGRCWEELEVRGLNQPRDEMETELTRQIDKIEYSRQSEAEDALERERSATDSLKIFTTTRMPDIKRGELVARAHTFRDDYTDKKNCQAIAEQLRSKNKNQCPTIASLLRQPEIAPYLKKYKGRYTVSDWLAETDPRPKDKRRGSPPKQKKSDA
jgi:hypothetical protein